MKKINHITWSFAISLWIYYYLFQFNLILTTTLAFFTGLIAFLPDIDIKIVNWSRKLMYRTLFILFPIHIITKTIFKHRTITHTLWIPLILLCIYYYLELNTLIVLPILVLALAIILHIFEDSLTVTGVEPFFPLPIKLRLAKFSTASTIHFIFLESISFLIVITFILSWTLNVF